MKQEVIDFVQNNPGKVLGLGIGIFIGTLYLFFGLFKTIIFVLLVAIGYVVGARLDQDESVKDLIERFLPNHWR